MTAPAVRLSPAEMAKLSTLAFNIAHNDKTREGFANLVRQVSPGDAKAFGDVFVKQQLAAFKQQIDNDRLKDKLDQANTAREAQRRDIQKTRRFSDAQMGELEKIREHYGLTDWRAAADIYSQRNPPENPALKPPPEVMEGGSTWEFPTVPGRDGKMLEFKDYIRNPRKHSNDIAIQMITDFKRRQLPSAFR
jgi:hypothetical protein